MLFLNLLALCRPLVSIFSDYPGGNIIVNKIGKRVIKLEQDLRDTDKWWFYWNFCIENAQEKSLTFKFTNGDVIGYFGPAVSHDGIDWKFLGSKSFISHNSFSYKFNKDETRVYFAFTLPYLQKNLDIFLYKYNDNPLLLNEALTTSEQGRRVPFIKIGDSDNKKIILITCKHHACESSASYVLEGIMQSLLTKKFKLLKEHLFCIIPFVDYDGVENGDQGKSRVPHDHNRDYPNDGSFEPIYKTTAAIMEFAKHNNVVVAFDLHAPWKWSGKNDVPFLIEHALPNMETLNIFGKALEQETAKRVGSEKIVYDHSTVTKAGQDWNDVNIPTFTNYFTKLGSDFTFGFELPYFGGPQGIFTSENCRAFGEDIIEALEKCYAR